MIKANKLIIHILLILILISLTGCDVDRKVKNKEIKAFTEKISESNEKILELEFYFRRPTVFGNRKVQLLAIKNTRPALAFFTSLGN